MTFDTTPLRAFPNLIVALLELIRPTSRLILIADAGLPAVLVGVLCVALAPSSAALFLAHRSRLPPSHTALDTFPATFIMVAFLTMALVARDLLARPSGLVIQTSKAMLVLAVTMLIIIDGAAVTMGVTRRHLAHRQRHLDVVARWAAIFVAVALPFRAVQVAALGGDVSAISGIRLLYTVTVAVLAVNGASVWLSAMKWPTGKYAGLVRLSIELAVYEYMTVALMIDLGDLPSLARACNALAFPIGLVCGTVVRLSR